MDWAAISAISSVVAAIATAITMLIAAVSAYVGWRQLFPPPVVRLERDATDFTSDIFQFRLKIENRSSGALTVFCIKASARNWAKISRRDSPHNAASLLILGNQIEPHSSIEVPITMFASEGRLKDFTLIAEWSAFGGAGKPKTTRYQFRA